MDAEYSKGQRLFVETNVGNLEGVFYYMDPGHNRLTLTGVVLQPSGKKMEGFRHYYRNEVISVRILDEVRCAGVSTKSEAVVEGNWIQKYQRAVQSGRVTGSDVMNSMSRDAAVSKSCVRILDEVRCAGVSTKSEAVVEGNWIQKYQRAVQPGRVTGSDVMNTMSRDAAVSKSCDYSELSEEEHDAVNKLVDNHVLVENVGDVFRKAMDAEYSKGQRLFVETNVGNLEGVFYYMDPGHNRLTLTGVVLQPSGKKMEGFSHYYRNEVISVRILDEVRCAGVSTKSEAVVEGNWIQKYQRAVQPGRVTGSDVMNTMSRDAAVSPVANDTRVPSELLLIDQP